jgi:hypothetical protein
MVPGAIGAETSGVANPPIEREEIVALLFNVSDIAVGVETIVDLLREDADGQEEADEG